MNATQDNKNENNNNVPKEEGHFEKYGIYYLVLSSFILTLLLIFFSHLLSNNQGKIAEKKLDKIEELFAKIGVNLDDIKDTENAFDGINPIAGSEFKIPDPSLKNPNWIQDVIPQRSVQQEFKVWINTFKYLPRYQTKKGPEIDSHVLLHGPPGTGKSFLARMFAENESCAYTFAEFKTKMYVGTSLLKMEQILEQAKSILKQHERIAKMRGEKTKPVVIVLDEMDSFARKDITGNDSSSVTESTGLQRLIDTVYSEKLNIIFVGITNDINLISQALLRPGRFGRRIEIAYPTEAEIEKVTNYLKEQMREGWKLPENRQHWDKDKDKDKEIVEWTEEFWKGVNQANLKISKKYRDYDLGFTYQDCQKSVNEAIAQAAGPNQEKIIPKSSDYENRLDKIMKDRLEDKWGKQGIWQHYFQRNKINRLKREIKDLKKKNKELEKELKDSEKENSGKKLSDKEKEAKRKAIEENKKTIKEKESEIKEEKNGDDDE